MIRAALAIFAFLFAYTSLAHTVLVTGGTGYIGSHVAVELLQSGYDVVIADNLINSKEIVLNRIQQIAHKRPEFYPIDLRDKDALEDLFRNRKIDSVIHMAGLKAVGESVEKPLLYYDNNLVSTIYLLEAMQKYGCDKLIFSSSATVYGDPKYLPYDEKHPLAPTNPYGQTKAMIDQILKDTAASDKPAKFVSLRYFNPIGAHPSGLIGEDPSGIPNNLMPYILQVVAGKRAELNIYGNDYKTKDGTGVRDYIHVVDLAKGHIAALRKLDSMGEQNFRVYNLGQGKGYSVLEVVNAVSKAWGKKVPYSFKPRRAGDIAEFYANPNLAKSELNWEAKLGIDAMAKDSLNWILKNPNGYQPQAGICVTGDLLSCGDAPLY